MYMQRIFNSMEYTSGLSASIYSLSWSLNKRKVDADLSAVWEEQNL